jgi:aldehyde dehydrogenase (NAD+)
MDIAPQHLLIDGELVDAADGREYDNINPATEEVAGTAPDAGHRDVERAVAAARRAFDQGRWATDVEFRRHCLTQLQDQLRKDVETIRTAHTVESGMPVGVAYAMGVDAPIEALGYWPELLRTYAWEHELPSVTEFRGVRSKRVVRKEPAGVVSAITPWNYPFQLNLAKIGHALAAGCTVVLKPAPETPWSGTLLAAAAAQTDLPPGVLNVITTSDNAVAEVLTTHPEVDQITFTGSTATGRLVMRNASETIKRVSLELGGKSAAIVLDDADLPSAVAAAAGVVCLHAGQGCVLMTRLLVPRSLLAQATEIAAAVMPQIPYGDPNDMNNLMGPLVSRRQLDRVLGYLAVGRQEARLVTGGGRAEQFERGYYVQPTVFTDVPATARIAREEIFGPVLSIIPFEDDADAVRLANHSSYGLSGAVYSGDPERALRVARGLRTGSVAINGGNFQAPDTPFGGYKQSGIGREFGVQGFEDFLETKALGIPV